MEQEGRRGLGRGGLRRGGEGRHDETRRVVEMLGRLGEGRVGELVRRASPMCCFTHSSGGVRLCEAAGGSALTRLAVDPFAR